YLTFDGGRTRVTNTAALLGISLSDGRTFTPTTNNSRDNPIILPVDGQSFNDIGMLVPTDTNSIALSSLIGTPYNYWGDDDGDGQGVNGVTATGSLNLLIVDKYGFRVARNEVLTICKAPYKLTLSNTEGTLTTRYGVPNESRFSASNATYYINPKTAPVICYITPQPLRRSNSTNVEEWETGLSADVYDWIKDSFLPQSVTPSSYGLNFPTTGAHNLSFDLWFGGVSQALSWAPVSHGGITATMTDSTSTGVRVTLRGPFARNSVTNPGRVNRPSLPQSFELVGRDSSGNAVVKYGFVLKQWFIIVHPSFGVSSTTFNDALSWCNKTGYHLPKVKDLTNARCGSEEGCQSATPSSPDYMMRRHIGTGLFTEWGPAYSLFAYDREYYTSELTSNGRNVFSVGLPEGYLRLVNNSTGHDGYSILCTYP
ncbi:hypothetical protein H3T83_11280, partial [Gilliamella sp. M0320]|uniref:hypothetical protein n=1 Tax=Gilliamella sp. M0320 TaxID=2750965 RepID=UPI0018DCA9FB